MDVFKIRGLPRRAPVWRALGWFKPIVAGNTASDPDREPVAAPVNVGSLPGKLRVLVVDDDPANLQTATDLLSACGITPLLATNGAQAVALARELRFDLILMDLQMPVLDGLGAARQIRNFECERQRANHRAAIVAYTSIGLTATLLHACGIDGFLAKPCDVQTLQDCLTRWCTTGAGAMAPSV